MQDKFALYAERFPIWASESTAMHQLAVWTALELEGFGANLQHYNPLIDEKVRSTWGVDEDWQLTASLVFGSPVGGPGEKTFLPLEERVKVFGA
jgi:predicted oxidoreductase (fatty acid repression mutant protein)